MSTTPPEERHAVLDALRAASPVHRDEASKTFILTGMAHVRALLTDNSLWRNTDLAEDGALVKSFKPQNMNGGRSADRDAGIGFLDDPDHTRVRMPIARALNRRVAAFGPAIEAIVAKRLDALTGLAAFDVVADFAAPIPIAAIGWLLGVDTADMAQFRAWSEAAIDIFNPRANEADRAATRAAAGAILAYLDEAMIVRRRERRDDLVADLIAAQESGVPLSGSEIRVNCMNLLLGGNITTADLIASAVWLLLSHPAELTKVRRDPSLIGAAIEETLRFEPPTQGTQRIVSRDMEIAGCPIRKGQVVATFLHAANRDPAAFADPHRFDIARPDLSHMSFGGGAHLCIGAPLARLEARIAVGALLQRYPKLALADPDQPPQWRDVPFFRGLASLRVVA